MENVSKALLIAAGVLIGLIVLTMLVVMHRQVTSYYTAKEKARTFEQLQEFNSQYTPYNRKNVRGNELISLINKIINFNDQEAEIGIEIKIRFNDNLAKAQTFYYNPTKFPDVKLINVNESYDYEDIKAVLEEANRIEEEYGKTLATELTANMFKVCETEDETVRDKYYASLKIDESIVDIDEMLKYYQYGQLKKAHFNCEELNYTENGRVRSFVFSFNGTFK